jgi:hypothetical protein
VRDLNSIRDSRPFRRLFRFPHVNGVEDLRDEVSQLRGGTGAYTQRALWWGVVRNPVAATVHFHRRVMIMNRVLLGISVSQPRTPPFATLRIVQISWCVRREDGEGEHRSFYVVGTDRLISQKAHAYHRITNAQVAREGVPIDRALQRFVDDCRWLRSVDGLLVAHQLEYEAGIILQELGRLPSMQSCRPLITALAARGICTMNASARRRGWKVRNTAAYYAMSLPSAFKFFVEPLGVSKWDDTFHHDSRYDVAKTLELYDALYRSVPTRADLEAGTRVAQATANDSDDYLEALEASQGSSVLVDDAAYASGLAESLSPS